MEMMKHNKGKLIISADDFGKSRLANENILSLVGSGKINRVAILVDGDISGEEAAKLSGSGVKLDIHLNLRKFQPRADEPRSVLKRIVLFLFYYLFKSNGSVGKEWEAQIEKFQRLFGRMPDGLNSHQYIHFFPPYFSAALQLAEKNKILYFRFGKSGVAKNMNYVATILRWLQQKDLRQFKKFNFATSDFLASFDWIKIFPLFLSELPPGKTEIIFHPERAEEFEAINKYF